MVHQHHTEDETAAEPRAWAWSLQVSDVLCPAGSLPVFPIPCRVWPQNQTVAEPRGRFPKLFMSADRTLQALGIKGKALRTLTMQALKIDGKQLVGWTLEGGQESTAAAATS